VSELVERRQLVSSARELIAEGKYQQKPAVRGWCEMVASLRGRGPGSSGPSAGGSSASEDSEESSLVRQLVSSETVSGSAGRRS
jgi:hypothetical protein